MGLEKVKNMGLERVKNIVLKICLYTILCVVYSCHRNDILHKNMKYTTIAINVNRAIDEIDMSEIFSTIEYIPLETNDEHLIGEMSQILIFKDRIYIADQHQTQSVFCYTKEGKFLYELSRKGQGPGEYITLDNISIDHDKERLLIYAGNILLEYDLDGNYIESHKIDLWGNDFFYIGNNRIAFYGDYTANTKYEQNQMTPNLFVVENYNVIYTDLYFPSKVNFGALLSLSNCISNSNNGTVSLVCTYNDTIYHVTSDTVKRAYYIDFGEMKKNKDFYQLIYSPTTTIKSVEEYKMRHDICNIIAVSETKDCIFFAYHQSNIYHYVFYYKNTNRIVDVYKKYTDETEPVFPITNNISGIRFAIPYFTDGHSFYGYIDAYEIAEMKASIIDPELKKKFENLSEYDNPVIVKMTPKIK
jgi:hypothetical protein